MKAVVLDSGPLGLISNPRTSDEAEACRAWVAGLIERDILVFVPEIADYEVRRELLRAGKTIGIARLDHVKAALTFLPISSAAMSKAAELWAMARRQGKPTAAPEALDGDAILAAQALTLGLLHAPAESDHSTAPK